MSATHPARSFTRRLFLILGVTLAWVGMSAGTARADMSRKVIKAFKGKILVTNDPLEAAGSDKETIAKFKKEALTEVVGRENNEEVWSWSFHYTAFLKSRGTPEAAIEFWDGNKFAANKRLIGIDPKLTVLEGRVTISEDDGLSKGKTYTVKLVGSVRGRDVTFASTTLSMK